MARATNSWCTCYDSDLAGACWIHNPEGLIPEDSEEFLAFIAEEEPPGSGHEG